MSAPRPKRRSAARFVFRFAFAARRPGQKGAFLSPFIPDPACTAADPLSGVMHVLPRSVSEQIRRMADGYAGFWEKLSEIRLRADRVASLTLEGRNIPLAASVSGPDMELVLHRCCEGSVYAYTESLREGYVAFGGCRVGVAGRAVMEDGVICGVDHVTSLVFRIPHNISGAAASAAEVFRRMGGRRGMLIYSAPGVGKTTLLRDLILRLSGGTPPLRVAVVDCRGELGGDFIGRGCLVDYLVDYPKAEGIEIATRTLSPEAVVCDEIGGFDEAESILAVQNCGVPLIASAHADSYASLLSRSPVRLLVECGIFGAFIGVHRVRGRYTYHVDYAPQTYTPPLQIGKETDASS